MSKTPTYPRKSFETAIIIAENVEKLGGKCTVETLADKLGKSREGGSFVSDVSSAVTHGLITREKNGLQITNLFNDIKLSYTEEEKRKNLIKSLLLPDTYREILERFNKMELPIDVLDKILIREYNVNANASKLVANNLIKAGTDLKIIDEKGFVNLSEEIKEVASEIDIERKVETREKKDEGKTNMKDEIVKSINNHSNQREVVININIQLTVPETTNEEVYEKFFSAMKKNLLS